GSGSVHTATVLGRARTEDVALLRIQGVSGLKAAQVGDASKVSLGDEVVAIGNALGRGGVPEVTSGTVTALDQEATAHDPSSGTSETLEGLIETNVPLQPGDSGGPLIDSSARVVGMNTAASGIGRDGEAGNIGLAIPVDRAMAIANQIRSGRATSTVQLGPRGFLGIQVSRARTNVAGAPVTSVGDGTPAQAAGMARGDVITSIDGVVVANPAGLTTLLEVHRPGESVDVGWRDASGQEHHARIRLGGGG
ncbi:MAG: S1C family serine protease, partial [Acidimicrobiales bacterium]